MIVEILSPGTERHDRLTKVPVYRNIDSVQEILLIDSESVYAEVLRWEEIAGLLRWSAVRMPSFACLRRISLSR